jgi:hypothetical protein
MRFSLLISILVHVVILWALLTLFDVVPQMKVPRTIYNVKIFRPFVAPKIEAPKEEPKAKVEVKKPEVTKPKPKPKEKPKEAEKKPEQKPAETKPEDKPMEVSMQEGSQTEVAVDAPRFPYSYYLSAIERKVGRRHIVHRLLQALTQRPGRRAAGRDAFGEFPFRPHGAESDPERRSVSAPSQGIRRIVARDTFHVHAEKIAGERSEPITSRPEKGKSDR